MKKRLLEPSAKPDPPQHEAAEVTATIEAMGTQGHGVARIGGGKRFVPFTLPGEHVRVELHGHKGAALEIETPSPVRIAAVCKHFGTCGGCALQHWADAPYKQWKQVVPLVAPFKGCS